MTVNFGGIKNVSACSPRYAGQGDVIWNCLKVSMHLDNNGSKDLEKVREILPDFKETDTLHIQSMRGSDNPIYNCAIAVNGAPYVNGIVNASYMKKVMGFLTQVIKSDDELIKPTNEFAISGQLKRDVYEEAADKVDIPDSQILDMFGHPDFVKQVAQDIIQDIRINAVVDMRDIFKAASDETYLNPPMRKPELPN